MKIVHVTFLPPRCWIFGRRVHHGLIGLALLLHDRKDRCCWLRDLLKHPQAR